MGQVQPIGIDIGRESVKLLQAAVSNRGVVVRCAASEPLPEETRGDGRLALTAAGGLIRRMLRSHPFRGRRAVAVLPRQLMFVKNLRLPVMPASEVEPAVQYEAAHMFPFAPEHAQVQYVPAGEVRHGGEVRQELIVLAARASEVNDYVELLHATGLRVESVDAEPCALFRGFERFLRRREDEQHVQVLCDIGYDRSAVVIGRGREMSFYKRIDIGGRHFSEMVSRKLGIEFSDAHGLRRRMAGDNGSVCSPASDSGGMAQVSGGEDPLHLEERGRSGLPADDRVRQAVRDAVRGRMEDLAREVSLCLRYYTVTFRGSRPERVLVVGGEAHDAQVLETLRESIAIPVEVGWPAAGVARRARETCGERVGPQWSVALGLSLKLTREHFCGWSPSGGGRKAAENVERGVRPGDAEVIDLDEALGGRAKSRDRQGAGAGAAGFASRADGTAGGGAHVGDAAGGSSREVETVHA